ncbi:MAG: hypothetical protein AABX77_00950 [Nanoarchaeota archaeon]
MGKIKCHKNDVEHEIDILLYPMAISHKKASKMHNDNNELILETHSYLVNCGICDNYYRNFETEMTPVDYNQQYLFTPEAFRLIKENENTLII